MARRRFLGLERRADRSAHGPALPEQPDPGVADRSGGTGAAAMLPAAEPARRRQELLPLVDDRQPVGRHQLPVHEVVQRGAGRARRRGAAGRGGGGGRGGRRRRRVESLARRAVPPDRRRSQTARFRRRSGSSKGGSWNVPVSYTFNKWGMFNTLNVAVQPRQDRVDEPLRATQTDVAGEAGIAGVSTDPFVVGHPVAVVHERERASATRRRRSARTRRSRSA
ncbi:MAG: hypothetical protein MZV63_23800 [Marinilabiliales bacterium]|nr:hypothetical protein [Marinilabiliales bacterium]